VAAALNAKFGNIHLASPSRARRNFAAAWGGEPIQFEQAISRAVLTDVVNQTLSETRHQCEGENKKPRFLQHNNATQSQGDRNLTEMSHI
jgi:hypothetical protein